MSTCAHWHDQPDPTNCADCAEREVAAAVSRKAAQTYADWKMGKPCTENHASEADRAACPLCGTSSTAGTQPSFQKQPAANPDPLTDRETFDWRGVPPSTVTPTRDDSNPSSSAEENYWAHALDRPASTAGPTPPHVVYTPYPYYGAAYGYPSAPESPYADIGSRFVAWFLDLLVWFMVALFTAISVENLSGSTNAGSVAFWLTVVAYYGLPTAFFGRTLGKLACGIKVVRADDFTRPPGLGWGTARFFTFAAMMIVPLAQAVDAGVASTDSQRRMVHDRAARTRVINIKAFARSTGTPTPQAPNAYPPPQGTGGPGYPPPGAYYPYAVPPKKDHRVLFVLLGLGVGLLALMWIAAIIQVSIDQSTGQGSGYHSVAKSDVEAVAAAEDAYFATSGGWWNGTIEAGTSRRIGEAVITPSPGNAITVQVLAEGGYCIRVDDTDDPSHVSHFYSSLNRQHTHAPCEGTPVGIPNSPTPELPMPPTVPPTAPPTLPTEGPDSGSESVAYQP